MKNIAKTTTLLYILFFTFSVSGQTLIQTEDSISRKKINVLRVTNAPKIDGVLDDAAWENAPVADGFVERTPVNGRPIPDSLKTEVKIVYDDQGIYFGATLRDPDPDKILTELTERDQIGNDDFFYVLLNGYNDRQQSLQFIVTAAGVQYDAKMTNDREDSSWNAIWYSEVKINDQGWVAEIFIPYSELRFPNRRVQTWGLNMEREFRRERTRYSWNHIDNTKGSFSIYDGEIHGIKNIEPPVRLSLQPYLSSYVNNFGGKTETVVNGGADLKYGINDAFTLDMILVPDFGQTKFDETVLNLSAFEVQFDEQRPFFMEGTELFSMGNLFYSRRIGGTPSGNVILNENEEITSFPSRVDLLNASKISGRTSGGLGIGFFNAITKKTQAEIVNTETLEKREVTVEPLTNYNILVLDQRFGQNSSFSFVNTNVLRDGGFTDANASALLLSLTNKKNTYRYNAATKGSWVMNESTKFGMEGQLQVANISGKNRTAAGINFRTIDYDINDLGFSANTNYINYFGYYGYRLLQPTGFLNSMNLNFNLNFNRRLQPDLYSSFNLNFNSYFTTKNFFAFGGGFEATPIGVNDIYEPRIEGRHFKVPAYYNPNAWISTDYRKKFALNVNLDWVSYNQKNRESFSFRVSPRFRFSDKWKVSARSSISKSYLEEGFANIQNDNIIFGQRDRNTIVNSIESQYIFNNKMALDLSFRHYYSEVGYHNFYTLENNGELTSNTDYTNEHDTTFNAWNVDLRYSWWFAPGSQLTFLYRNAIDSFINQSGLGYSQNLNDLFDRPQLNSFSIRISYFLDYNRIKNVFHQNNDDDQNGGPLPLKMDLVNG